MTADPAPTGEGQENGPHDTRGPHDTHRPQDARDPRAAARAPEAAAGPPLVAGRYRLEQRIAAGGMGAVWSARDTLTGHEVALKEMHLPAHLAHVPLARTDPAAGAAARSAAVERMRREARAAGRVDHPSVVTIHDVVVHDEHPWIVMELVRGETLADLLDREGALPEPEAARIALPVLEGLRAAHARGVLHRDVKPANVLLGTDGRVVLTDFGIARIEGETSLTVSGEFLGSLRYCAPERMGGRRPGPASDLWSLGVLLYEAIEGWSPFRRETMEATVAAVLTGAPEEPARAERLGPLVRGLLAQDPEDRPDAEEVLAALQETAALAATPAPETVPSPEAAPAAGTVEETVRAPAPGPSTAAAPGPAPDTGPGAGGRWPGRRTAVRDGMVTAAAVLVAGVAGWAVLRGGTHDRDAPPDQGRAPASAAPWQKEGTRTYDEQKFGYRIAVPASFSRTVRNDRITYRAPGAGQVWIEVYRDPASDGSGGALEWAREEIEWLTDGAVEDDGARTARTQPGALAATRHAGRAAARYAVQLQTLERGGAASAMVVQRNLVVGDGRGGMYQLRVSVPESEDEKMNGAALFATVSQRFHGSASSGS